jgi:hypothetical protein
VRLFLQYAPIPKRRGLPLRARIPGEARVLVTPIEITVVTAL